MALVKRKLPNGTVRYYADFRAQGGKQISLKTADAFVAGQEHARLERALYMGVSTALNPQEPTLDAAFAAAFKQKWSSNGFSSRRTYGYHQQAIYAAIPKTTPLSQIGVTHFNALTDALRAKGNGDATIGKTYETLQRVLNLAVDWKMLDRAPKCPKFKRSRVRTREYTDADEAAMLAEFARIHPDMVDAFIVLLDTGMRLSELLERELTIGGKVVPCLVYRADQHSVFLDMTKDPSEPKSRLVPLTVRAEAALKRWLAHPTISKDAFESRWATMRANIGQQGAIDFIPHSLRHTCASRLHRAGVPIGEIMRWLGHSDIKTTMKYIKTAVQDLNSARDRLQAGTGVRKVEA